MYSTRSSPIPTLPILISGLSASWLYSTPSSVTEPMPRPMPNGLGGVPPALSFGISGVSSSFGASSGWICSDSSGVSGNSSDSTFFNSSGISGTSGLFSCLVSSEDSSTSSISGSWYSSTSGSLG